MVRSALFAAVLAAAFFSGPTARAASDRQGPTTHVVYPGHTLGKIARRYNVGIDELCRANGLRRNAPIKPGQKLVIPDGKELTPAAPARKASQKWQDYAERPRKRGYVVLESPTKRWRGYVISPKGNVLPRAKQSIERMLASWRTGSRHSIDARLIQLVAKMSDTFGGRPIRVVSGYRERSFAVESKHKLGRAFDFSITGVPNSAVRDYLRTLPRVGVGYYPNSTHVHVDVRDEKTYWVDNSAPGEAPRYAGKGRPEEPGETEAIGEAGASIEEGAAPASGGGGVEAAQASGELAPAAVSP